MPSVPLTVDDVVLLHEFIVEHGERTEPGVSNRGDIAYALDFVRDGHYGESPETIHEMGANLLRLLVANHPSVDGNKRTALASTVALYGLNAYELDYNAEVREILKAFATDEQAVDIAGVVAYLDTHAAPLDEDWRMIFRAVGARTAEEPDENQQNDVTPAERSDE
jgi:death-on-curing protein